MPEQPDDEALLARAVQLSRLHMEEGAGGPFGAVIATKDGRIIAEGWNGVTSGNDPTAHAEMVAIRRACAALGTFDLSGHVIYSSCEPCPMCLGAVYWARLERLVFANSRADAAAIGFDDARIYDEIPKPIEARLLPTVHRPSREATAVFAEWLKKADRIPY
ncbi:MAG: nucleoside deaminase [Methylobacterium sp.]|jgi:guanine deaminase|nr:nucleoside deaminase [Methylobacterium sp.]MCA3656307.1 nucleoside deaminase [Methylobacterium sp.]MCA3658677.1 nucleoside deaminase [Methylobacterium sp.]MCA3660133.1 nucleoside deaminase [Methylobacterium sp.]MCA3663725.1 nucleoside deaminase [Methylobacterium sp.]